MAKKNGDITIISNSRVSVIWATFAIINPCCFYCYGIFLVSCCRCPTCKPKPGNC